MAEAIADVESKSEEQEQAQEVRIANTKQHEELYDPALPTAYAWSEIRPAFVRGLVQVVSTYRRFDAGRTLDKRAPSHEEPGALLVYPNEMRVFVGLDKTSHNRGDFGFAVQPNDPVPLPETVGEALSLLKPLGVQSHLQNEGVLPQRQGEWWLLDTDEEPSGTIYKGGVNERPFNGSPMENHVPTEFGFGVEDEVLWDWFESNYSHLVRDGDALTDIFRRMRKAQEHQDMEDVELVTDVPGFSELREAAGKIFVKGTLRHRENDHYMETIGEVWKEARTHDVEVFTAGDTSAAEVRMD